MARNFAAVNVTIHQDADWRRVPALAKHLYLTLWTHPELSYAGVVDWRPGRIARLIDPAWDSNHVRTVAACLEARHFLVVDEDTEECLIRSWVRFDGLMKEPRMAVSFAKAYAAVGSDDVRGVIVHEARKLREAQPELAGWGRPQVVDLLTQPATDPKSRAVPSDPFGDDFGHGFGPAFGPGSDETLPDVSMPPTPSPSPTPLTPAPTASPRRAPERPLPDDWKPKDKHAQFAAEHGIDLPTQVFRFRNHAHANDRRQRSWDASFSTWLSKELERMPKKPVLDQRPEGWR